MIDEFKGENRFLSNFWPAPVTYEGLTYLTVEHAYQASKTLDRARRHIVRRADTPGSAKRLGRQLELRFDWKEVRLGIMEDLVRQKFELYPDLGELLLGTGDRALIEGNTWNDTFWGVCRGVGRNNLGRILMRVRFGLLKAGMGNKVSGLRLRDNYLAGRTMNDLSKAELTELSRHLGLDPDKLPASYRNARHMRTWIDNWLAHEIIQNVAERSRW